MLPEDRRVPFQNMIYVADGPSDVPVFSVVGSQGGRTFAVYQPEDEAQFRQVNELQRRGRVEAVGPADYTTQSQTAMWLRMAVEEIANRIQTTRDRAFGERIGQAPRHLPEPPAEDRSSK